MTDRTATTEDVPEQSIALNRWVDVSKWLPATLMGRSALIIVVPLILVQVLSTFIFYDNHWETLSRRLAQGLAGDISHIRVYMRDNPGAENFSWIQMSARQTMALTISYDENAALAADKVITGDGPFPDVLTRELWRELKRPFTIDFRGQDGNIEIGMQLPDGVLNVIAPRKRLFSSTTYVFVIWMVGSSLLLFGVAALFLNVQVRAVRRLARAADSFGKGRDMPNFKPEGAMEVRQAARAFTAMKNRIQRQIDQRTEMLAGVSHDLRTPLTRLRLQIEMLDGIAADDVDALKQDVDDMQRMLDGYLAFARGEGDEAPQEIDLGEYVSDLEKRLERDGVDVRAERQALTGTFTVKPMALQRCVANLIGNAKRYAKTVVVSVQRSGSQLDIIIDDDGPGIPPEERESAFKPFYRMEASRNPETGGVGLGLTIARDFARSLGGDVVLSSSPQGGLRAVVQLPV